MNGPDVYSASGSFCAPTRPAALRYPGAKWSLAPRIIEHFEQHRHYVEPFFGSGAVFFTKPPSQHEVINDLDGRVVNFWRMLRERTDDLVWALETTAWSRAEYDASDTLADDPLKDARRFAVRAWQAHASDLSKKTGWKSRGAQQRAAGMSHRWQAVPAQLREIAWRLSDAEIENRDAIAVVTRHNSPDTLLYVDPPYVPATRTQKVYACEMDEAQHRTLIEALTAHRGSVVLSGYDNALYNNLLAGWDRIVMTAPKVEKGARRSEVLWIKKAD